MGNKNVVVLGASSNPERYSNKAVKLLSEHGYSVIPVHPAENEIEGLPVKNSLSEITEDIYTLSLYLSPQKSPDFIDDIIKLNPQRVIMNPGAESDIVEEKLTKENIKCIRACTLVLLRTDQFEKY